MLSVFLSASNPLPHRHPKYLETADVAAIRDSIRAVVSVVVPRGQIVFGGHPATTPLIRLLVRGMTPNVRKNVILYQSLFFKPRFPPEVYGFEEVRFIDAVDGDLDASLTKMRGAMIGSHDFDAAVFLGGMEGVETEYDFFRRLHPGRPAYPVASTGAAARILFEKYSPDRLELRLFRVLGRRREQERGGPDEVT
ncbi:MAG TPA: hypothetical protein VE959_31555 [Bryobacteraceae bacterium]|nr:hypothetical protein [Bryobacteraceae bacterium]